MVAPTLTYKIDGHLLQAGLHMEESKKTAGSGLIDWRIGVTVDVQTAQDCEIELYIQPEGIPADGGQQYRIPLGPWAGATKDRQGIHGN